MDKQNVVHPMEYYSAMKRNEIMTDATAWKIFEDMTLSERSQSQKATYGRIPSI